MLVDLELSRSRRFNEGVAFTVPGSKDHDDVGWEEKPDSVGGIEGEEYGEMEEDGNSFKEMERCR